jgi:hypothetical protein
VYSVAKVLIGDSFALTSLFFVLVFFAVSTQHTAARSVPYLVRGPVKAAPAFFLAAFSWYLNGPPLLTFAFLSCACGDILLDIAKEAVSRAFEVGAAVFAVALVCLSLVYLDKPLDGRPLLLLSLPNIVLALFVCLWVLPKLRNSLRFPALAYLAILVASNIIASTSLMPVFLGSTLWLMSDLAIGIGRNIPGSPANGLTNLGLYDLGLYFIAVGFLNN